MKRLWIVNFKQIRLLQRIVSNGKCLMLLMKIALVLQILPISVKLNVKILRGSVIKKCMRNSVRII